jgi:enamine deaminase RidA (YjgF/YER057c/UK114 family)
MARRDREGQHPETVTGREGVCSLNQELSADCLSPRKSASIDVSRNHQSSADLAGDRQAVLAGSEGELAASNGYLTRRRGHNTEVIMSKPSKEFINPKTLIAPAVAVYSHIATVNRGRIAYISGQVSSDASGKIIGEGDFEAQVEQVFANLKIAIEAAGGVMADIVKLNYFLAAEVDQADVPKMRPIRDRYLNVANPPASTFVVVSRLMRPGWLIEIEAVAAIDD